MITIITKNSFSQMFSERKLHAENTKLLKILNI